MSRAIDGYLQNCACFLDYNNDDSHNSDEPFAFTDSYGGFTLNVPARDLSTGALVVVKTDIVGEDGSECIDSFTSSKPGFVTLRAPMNALVVTPLTTIAIEVASLYRITNEGAAELILQSLGLTNIDSDLIFNVDPFQKLVLDRDESIATLAYALVNFANSISMISSLIYGGGSSSLEEAESATILAFAKRIGESTLTFRKKKKKKMLLRRSFLSILDQTATKEAEVSTHFLNVSDSSDISAIISDAVNVVSLTSPDVYVESHAREAIASASSTASAFLLSSSLITTDSSNVGEAISKACAASTKILQDPVLLSAIKELGNKTSVWSSSTTLITDLSNSTAMSAKYDSAKSSIIQIVIPHYPPPPSPPPPLQPPNPPLSPLPPLPSTPPSPPPPVVSFLSSSARRSRLRGILVLVVIVVSFSL